MKWFSIVIVLLVLAGSVLAGRIDYGFKGGICLSAQDFDLSTGAEFKTSQRIGPEIGFFFEFYPWRGASLSASAMLTERGMKSDLVLSPAGKGQLVETASEDNHISYFSLALLAKKRFALSRGKMYVLIGPRLDIRYGSGGHAAITTVYDDAGRLVPGLSGGIGWETRLPRLRRLFFELIYNHDLSDAYSGADVTIKNRSLSILAGLKI